MPSATANVPTAHAAKYLQQLCKHWAHKLDTTLEGNEGTVRFESATAHMLAGESELAVRIEAESPETLELIKDVVARHLDRFAFREAPLPFDWRDASTSN